jgi:hypothetical protein
MAALRAGLAGTGLVPLPWAKSPMRGVMTAMMAVMRVVRSPLVVPVRP